VGQIHRNFSELESHTSAIKARNLGLGVKMKTLIAKVLIAGLAIAGIGMTSATASESSEVTVVVMAPADALASYDAVLASYESALAVYEASAKTKADYKVLRDSFKPLGNAFRKANNAIEKSFKANVKVAKQARRAALAAAPSSVEKSAARATFVLALAAHSDDRDALLADLGDLPTLPQKPAGGKGKKH
jgi:hypothetical protein